MANATITGTASNFGSISGVLAGEAGTVAGTITGAVAGSLTGSVGVPGPGVPSDGLEGQILAKASDTSYDTEWIDNYATELRIVARNETGATLAKGTVVYINGAAGNKPTLAKALATGDATSAQTLGMVSADILNNQNGEVTVRGLLAGLNTSSFAAGTQLYLSGTTAGAVTSTKPSAPVHLVYVGIVSRQHVNQGQVEVAVQNGFELHELHDVKITSVSNGQVLKYDSAQGLWVNGTDVGGVAWGGITGTLSAQTDLQTALDAKAPVGNYLVNFGDASALNFQADFESNRVLISKDFGIKIQGSNKIEFNDSTLQDTAYPGASGFLLKADNLSGLANTATARTNLGLGTMATETASNYLTTATASSTYAPLASPALTGTPTAPTAAAATNTTQIATTAFVQQEVPAASTTAAGKVELATNAEVITTNSTSLVPSLDNIPAILSRPENRSFGYVSYTTVSGSGSVSGPSWGLREMYLGSLAIGRAGFAFGLPGVNQAVPLMSRANNQLIDFSKKIWLSGKACAGFSIATNYMGDSNTICRITLGGYNNNGTGDMTGKGIGWKKVGGTSSYFTLTVHNGTTRTDVATTVQQSDKKVIDWVIYSDGTGNVTLYIDGTQAATTSAGPTGTTTAGWSFYREQVEATATPTVRQIMHTTGGNLYIEG